MGLQLQSERRYCQGLRCNRNAFCVQRHLVVYIYIAKDHHRRYTIRATRCRESKAQEGASAGRAEGCEGRSRHHDVWYDMILDHLVDGVPLLDSNLLWSRSDLRGDKLLEVSDRVVLVALHPHLPARASTRASVGRRREREGQGWCRGEGRL